VGLRVVLEALDKRKTSLPLSRFEERNPIRSAHVLVTVKY